jgi:sugar phosphate isomerase/epimerase
MPSDVIERLAVCSWSLEPTSPQDLISKLRDANIAQVQLALNPLLDNANAWGGAGGILESAGIRIVSGMFGCVGEDYSTLESIRATGGIAPDATWQQNLKNIRAASTLAAELGLKLVTFHAGFLPHAESDPKFSVMLNRLSQVAQIFAERDIHVALETGQEKATDLATVLMRLKESRLGVNFDPANMLLYGSGDPIEALKLLAEWIRQVHIKDAKKNHVAGIWGEEMAAGSGEVDWPSFFSVLKEIHFTGNFVIEREAGTQRVADVRTAKSLVEQSAK